MRGAKRRHSSASASRTLAPRPMRSTNSASARLSTIEPGTYHLNPQLARELEQQSAAVAAERAAMHGGQRRRLGPCQLGEQLAGARFDGDAAHVFAQRF